MTFSHHSLQSLPSASPSSWLLRSINWYY